MEDNNNVTRLPHQSDIKGDADQCSNGAGGGGKRRRAPNFTDKEIKVLLKLVFEHIGIIENKKTDSETWRLKDIVWNMITDQFNNELGACKRTVEMVRQKYDSIKKIARRKEAKNKEEETKAEPDYVDLECHEKELLQLIEALGSNQLSSDPNFVNVLVPEKQSYIKTENLTQPVEPPASHQGEEDRERFIVTDDDVLWDLPSDVTNRPRLHLVKKQLEQLEREEQRQTAEHALRMRLHQIKRKFMINQEARTRKEHLKRMELLELELELKRKQLKMAVDNT